MRHKQVCGLQVAVDYTVAVRKAEAAQELKQKVLEVLRGIGGTEVWSEVAVTSHREDGSASHSLRPQEAAATE